MAELKGETVEANTSPEFKKIKDCALHDYAGLNGAGTTKMLFSTSRLSGEQAFESADSDSKNGSTLAFESNSKCHEADMQSSSVGVASARPTSVKSEISTETHLTHGNGSFEMDTRKMQRSHLIAAEDGLNTMIHDSQQTTESSCSNSLPVVAPVSFSNHSYQETSKEAYLFRNCGSPMDSSNSRAFDRSPEEPVTASSESGVSAQIASKAIRNANARSSMKILSLDGNHSLSLINKGDRDISHNWNHEAATPEDVEVLKKSDDVKCISRNTSCTEEQNPSPAGKISVCSDNSDNFYCTSRSVKDIRLSGVHDSLPTSHSREKMMKHEISGEGGVVLGMKGKSLGMGSEVMGIYKDEFWVNESSGSSMKKRSKKSVKDQDKVIAGFDLNEDINADGPDDCVQPVFASLSSHSVIHVVAKAGIPSGQPMIPLKFEGGLGWKGTAETSAFRPTSLSKNSDGKKCSTNHMPKDPEGFTGIDLNVAFLEDIAANRAPMEHEGLSSPSTVQDSHSEVDRKQAKSPWIDLNCLYDAADESTQPSIPLKSENLPLVDLNLDTSASLADRSNNAHWLRQGCQFLGNKASDFSNPGTRDFSFPGNVYFADFSTMQRMAKNHTLMASPHILQPMQRVVSHTLPPHGYSPSPNSPFHFGSKDPLPSSVPYTRFYREHGIFPEAFNHGSVHSSYNTPHLAQFLHEQSSSNVTSFVPKLEVKTEDLLSASGSKIDGPRQFPFLSSNSPMGEHMRQEAWYATPLKRKEPEGGYKQVM
ncbi:hypothetical protein C2S51_019584 [Perilla frutescens var. frutescens]|nr:hypothetical protein C2S51_019584 [Perilla frutescens var. frutescens]